MTDSDDLMSDLLAHRSLVVRLELRLERRIRLYADRLNRRLAAYGDAIPYDVEDDRDLASLVMLLCETSLDEDEDASGLTGDQITGHLISREVADEQSRRKRP